VMNFTKGDVIVVNYHIFNMYVRHISKLRGGAHHSTHKKDSFHPKVFSCPIQIPDESTRELISIIGR